MVVAARSRMQISRMSMGGCESCGPFLGPLSTRCITISRTHKGTIILTATHMGREISSTASLTGA